MYTDSCFQICIADRGILMTFGSGSNGCLGHGNFNDVSQAKIVEKLLGVEVSMVGQLLFNTKL